MVTPDDDAARCANIGETNPVGNNLNSQRIALHTHFFQNEMNPFVKDFKELILMTSPRSAGDETLPSKDEVLKRLRDFDESYRDYSGGEDLSSFKLRLLGNLTFFIASLQKNDEKLVVLESMRNVLCKAVVDDIQFFIHLYNTAFYQIYKEQEKLSEEIKLAVLEFSNELIKRSTKRLLQLLYNVEYGAKFSMGVLIAVQIAKEEKSIKLRTTALDFLLYAMQYHRTNDKIIQSAVGDLFMLYLPGVIGRLEDIILRDETQNHVITVKATTCWGQLLCTVLKDIEEESKLTDDEQVKMWMNFSKTEENDEAKAFNMKKALQEKTRSKEWLEAAAQTLRPLIVKISKGRKHSHPKVRMELTIQISRILENCLMTLKTAINPMLEILMSSSDDDEGNVRDAAELALSRFEARCRRGNGQVYLNFIEENLNSLLIKFPNVVHLKDDGEILNAMKTLSGDLKILTNSCRLGRVVNCSSTLVRLLRVLVITSTLELYPEVSTQDYSVWENEDNPGTWRKEWKRFKHFADEKIARKLSEVCRLLGSSSEVETILDYLFDRLKEEQSHRNEVLLLVNEIVSGSSDLEDNIVRQFLDAYLNPDYLYLVLEVDDENCLNVHQSHTNIITVALLMEGIGKLSKVIGCRFQQYLLRSLYHIIERMGSSYRIIRTTAMAAAVEIASAVGLNGDVRVLIQKNVDYLTYHITVKLRRNHPGVFDVVTVLMKNSPFEAITNLEEIINNVVKNSSERFESPHTISYLRLFQTFVLCVNRWMTERKAPEAESPKEETKTEVDSLIDYIEEKEKPKEEDEEVPESAEAETMETEKEEKIPKHIELVVSIAENALNHLPSNDFDRKLIVLEILNEAVLILADWENQLLPLVHKIWSPLVTRFDRMSDPLLINRSFELLYNLSKTSKDFIRRRTLKNVLPTLRDFLSKSAEMSKLKDSGTGYQYTQVFKLQRQLLGKLAAIAVHLRLTGKEVDSIVECALPYLSNLQPQPLQEMCRKFFSDLSDYDPYLVWYKLNALRHDAESSGNAGKLIQRIIPAGR